MDARGKTVREIQVHLQELYGAEVSPGPDLAGDLGGDRGGQEAPEAVYPIVYLILRSEKFRDSIALVVWITRRMSFGNARTESPAASCS